MSNLIDPSDIPDSLSPFSDIYSKFYPQFTTAMDSFSNEHFSQQSLNDNINQINNSNNINQINNLNTNDNNNVIIIGNKDQGKKPARNQLLSVLSFGKDRNQNNPLSAVFKYCIDYSLVLNQNLIDQGDKIHEEIINMQKELHNCDKLEKIEKIELIDQKERKLDNITKFREFLTKFKEKKKIQDDLSILENDLSNEIFTDTSDFSDFFSPKTSLSEGMVISPAIVDDEDYFQITSYYQSFSSGDDMSDTSDDDDSSSSSTN